MRLTGKFMGFVVYGFQGFAFEHPSVGALENTRSVTIHGCYVPVDKHEDAKILRAHLAGFYCKYIESEEEERLNAALKETSLPVKLDFEWDGEAGNGFIPVYINDNESVSRRVGADLDGFYAILVYNT